MPIGHCEKIQSLFEFYNSGNIVLAQRKWSTIFVLSVIENWRYVFAMSYSIFWEEKGVRWKFSGEVTDQEMLDANKEFYDSPVFYDMRYQIGDFLEVTDFKVSSDTVKVLARLDLEASEKNPNVKVAFVVTNVMIKGLTRMWDLSGGGTHWESSAFEDEASAREWLGI